MRELKLCPFCGAAAKIHQSEFPTEIVNLRENLPRGTRIIKEIRYPNGEWKMQVRKPAYTPQCSDETCIGRLRKQYKSEEEAVEAWNERAEIV